MEQIYLALKEQHVSRELLDAITEFRDTYPVEEERRSRIVRPALPYYGKETFEMAAAALLQGENILLTGIGIVAGVFMGSILHRFVIRTVEVDLIMFGRTVHPVSYLYGAGLTALFAVLVNVTMFYKLRRIDMVESLKSVE